MHRKLSDERFHQAWVRCPDCDAVLVPTGAAYSIDLDPQGPADWLVAFRCPNHDTEVLRIWRPEIEPLIAEALAGVDVASLPAVDEGLKPA